MNDLITNRCQRILPSGQCDKEALPDSDRCEQHTGKQAKSKSNLKSYQINDVRVAARLTDFLESDRLYSLAEEIAIIKMTLERFAASLTMESTPDSLLEMTVRAPMIIKLVETLQKLVVSGVQTELKVGSMMTKDTVQRFATRMVQIMADELAHIEGYQLIVDAVTTRFAEELRQTKNKQEDD